MSHMYRSQQEWFKLITQCRQSGMTDRDWCIANGISRSTFYKAVMRLRKSACELPPSAKAISSVMDLTASSKQDIVPISIIPDAPVRELSCNHSKAASTHYVMEINTGDITIRVSNDVTNSLLSHTLKILGGMS